MMPPTPRPALIERIAFAIADSQNVRIDGTRSNDRFEVHDGHRLAAARALVVLLQEAIAKDRESR